MGSQTGADSRTGAGSGTASWLTASSWMASRPCWTEEAFLLRRRERGSRITVSGGSTASWVASGGAAAASAVSGGTSAVSWGAVASSAASGGAAAVLSDASRGATAGPFFLLLRLLVIGGLGLPLTAGGKGGQSVEWDFVWGGGSSSLRWYVLTFKLII